MRYISEITLTSDFLKYLLELGFPRESIVTEFRLFDKITKRAIYADIGIINPKTKDILLLIEIKNNENTALAAAQLARYLEATGNAFIQGAVVIPGKEFEKFQIYILDKENKTLKKEPPDFIYYLSIVNGYAAQKVDEIRKEEERAYDSFKVICIVLSVFSFFLLITDIVIKVCFEFVLITPERLGLLGFGGFCILAPYYKKIKALGIELKRNIKT